MVAGLIAVAAGSGSAKGVAGIAAAVAATNALIEVWRTDRVTREPRPAAPEWWRARELAAKARARLWTLLAGALTLGALARDSGADGIHGVGIAGGIMLAALGALLIVAVGDARAQGERALAMPNGLTVSAGVLVLAAGLAALVWGSW